MKSPIRVMIVDDVLVDLTLIRQMLRGEPDIEVVATARNGRSALKTILNGGVDVLLTDLRMPEMDGLELTRAIMRDHPIPIIVLSGDYDDRLAFTLLEAGALDILPKPRAASPVELATAGQELARRIRVLAGVRVLRRYDQRAPLRPASRVPPRLIVIGASTGGPQALHDVLASIPSTFPVPIICIQHIADRFLGGFLDWLGSKIDLKVAVARAGEHPEGGCVYFPPEDLHLAFTREGNFRLLSSEPVDGHRPSVTFTMQEAARVFGRDVLGVLLTGMGRDGAAGLLAIHNAGGRTIAQNEETSVVYGMPAEAARLGAVQSILPLSEIGRAIVAACVNPNSTHVRNAVDV